MSKKLATTTQVPNHQLGAKASPPDPRRIRYDSLVPATVTAAKVYPENFSLFDKSLGITNQDYGSCVGASHAKECEYQEKDEGRPFEGDYRALYALCKRMDGQPGQEGTYPAIAAKIRTDYGVPRKGILNTPYSNHAEFIEIPADVEEILLADAFQHRSTGYVWASTIDHVRDLLTEHETPVTVTFNCPSNYFATDAKGNVLDTSGSAGLHRMLIVGWKTENGELWFQVQNSWSANFGVEGYCYIKATTPFYEALADVDFVESAVTVGAPADLHLPFKDFYLIQAFGEDFKDPDQPGMYYANRGLKGHPGVDCKNGKNGKIGDPVEACDAGKVIYSGNRGASLGNTVIIQHAWGTSHYNHLDSGNVGVGDQVQRAQVIGKMGKTGKVTGPHTHWGITINGVTNPGFSNFVNPMAYVHSTDEPDVGFAKDPASPLQVLYIKIPTAARWDEVSDMFKTPKVVPGQANDIPKLAERGFVYTNMPAIENRTVIFYLKLSDQNQKNVLAGAFKLDPNGSVPLTEL